MPLFHPLKSWNTRNTREPELPACSPLKLPGTRTKATRANQTLAARPEKKFYVYIFFLFEFQPPKYSSKKKKNQGRLGWVSFYEHLLPRRTVDLPTPRLLPAHIPAQPRMGTQQSWWGSWEAGRGSSALGSGVGLRLRGGGELPKCSHLCSVTEPRSLAGAVGTTQLCVRQARQDAVASELGKGGAGRQPSPS